ncbi:hypothetical protein [Desulfuribacillus alkaliarsenatis]|uniref:Uncharacterized protein n=1 Tax=Desulfuribacillus alkaliarsenatis TaxID=766136 RepID=A0A1E5G1Z5_9FIRM|nr:hypothetical protein [Desulfuribacillus alkaliarsenatis]OEF96549.1 hypothetical protein BHF68_07830 [Desulfuribacillus alkaliarsenatis]
MSVINFYVSLIKGKLAEAYSTKGIEGFIKKIETWIGIILLAFLFMFLLSSLVVSIWFVAFFLLCFLFITFLLKTDRISFLFLGVPYLILLALRVLSSFQNAHKEQKKQKEQNGKEFDADMQYFKNLMTLLITIVLLPFVSMLAIFIWVYFLFYAIDFLFYLLEIFFNYLNSLNSKN